MNVIIIGLGLTLSIASVTVGMILLIIYTQATILAANRYQTAKNIMNVAIKNLYGVVLILIGIITLLYTIAYWS